MKCRAALLVSALLTLSSCGPVELPVRKAASDPVVTIALVGRVCAGPAFGVALDGDGPRALADCATPLPETPIAFEMADGSAVEIVADGEGRFRAEMPAERRLVALRMSCAGGSRKYRLQIQGVGGDPLSLRSEHRLALRLPYSACAPAAAPLMSVPLCDGATLATAFERLRQLGNGRTLYVEDGAADGTVLIAGPGGKAPREVRTLLACPQDAARLLVSQLTDMRTSLFTCRTTKTKGEVRPVPMGHVAMDLLQHLAPRSQSPPHLTPGDCSDDGFGACLANGYYFRPDDYELVDGEMRALPIVAEVQANWQTLLDTGRLQPATPGHSR